MFASKSKQRAPFSAVREIRVIVEFLEVVGS